MSAEEPVGHEHTDTPHSHDEPAESSCCSSTSCASEAAPAEPPGDADTVIHVAGLCCESEVAIVHKRLRIAGVTDVRVNAVAKRVYVRHDRRHDGAALALLLDQAGLGAKVIERGHAHTIEATPFPIALALAAGLWVLSFGTAVWEPMHWFALAAIALGVPPIARKALYALRTGVLDMNALMTLAIIGAVFIGEWVEGATVVVLFALSEWLESRSLDRARGAMAQVMSMAPEQAELPDGTLVATEAVALGTVVAVRPGARVPLDGKVLSGRSAVDESALTGESAPVDKVPGDVVSAGTINTDGYLEVQTTALAADSAVARLAHMVEEAQTLQSPTERFVDRFAAIYTPVVVVAAALIAVVPPLVFGADASSWGYRALVLLVVACPCALVISTPVTVVSALARAARRGVLIKGGAHLETLGRLTHVAFDKTGTLTEGRFEVVDCHPAPGATHNDLHRVIAAAEAPSSHPIASALLRHAGAHDGTATAYQTIEGQGIAATVDGATVYVGNHRLAERMGWCDDEVHTRFEAFIAAGRTVVYAGTDDRLLGLHALADVPRSGAAEAVSALRERHLGLSMLTGDNRGTADAVRLAVGLDEARSELLPQDKLDAIRELSSHGVVAMVGDGINDGPALAAADVGIAMGVRGTALAMETADVALMTDDLRRLPEVIDLGRRALRVIRLNIGFAIAVKLVVLGLAVAGLAGLWMAVLADVGASLIVIGHGLTLLRGAEGSDERTATMPHVHSSAA